MRDSNPRMLGPEPSALPLGESPTQSHLTILTLKNQPLRFFIKACYNEKAKHKRKQQKEIGWTQKLQKTQHIIA